MAYPTTRQFAKKPTCPVTECVLRGMIKRHEIPGFWAGNRFYIDEEETIRMFKDRCLATVRKGNDYAATP